MFCSNCGKEVEDNQKFCKNCGKKLQNNNNFNQLFNSLKNQWNKLRDTVNFDKIIKIIAITLLIVILFIGGVFGCRTICENIKDNIKVELPKNKQNTLEYKSIKSIYDEITDLNSKQALEKLVQQEQDLKEFLSQNHSPSDNDKLFSTFFENVLAVAKKINNNMNNLSESAYLDSTVTTSCVCGIQFSSKTLDQDNFKGTFRAINPKTNLIRTVFAYPFNIEPDFSYICDNYSKYLSKPFHKYLGYKKQEQLARKDLALWMENKRNANVSKNMVVNNLLLLRGILNETPDFPLWYNVLEDIKIYTDAFLCVATYDDTTSEQFIALYNKFLRKGTKNSYEYGTIKEFKDIYTTYSFEYYDNRYCDWYSMTFYDGEPIVTQTEINTQYSEIYKIQENKFKIKQEEYNNLQISDNGKLSNYMNGYKNRRENIENIIFNSDDYGSNYSMQIANFRENFNDLELYIYQKIADTYKNKYEHTNKIKMEGYHEYYEEVVAKIMKSDKFATVMRKYIKGYSDRKISLKEVVSEKMNDTNFDVWFDKLELYAYKMIMMNINGLENAEEEIDKIFSKE